MLMKDPKKSIALIIGRMKKGGGEEMAEAPKSEEGGEVDNGIGIESAAEEIMAAIESKDAKSLVGALRSFMEMCEEEMPKEQPSEEKPE